MEVIRSYWRLFSELDVDQLVETVQLTMSKNGLIKTIYLKLDNMEGMATRLSLDSFDNSESIFAAPSVGKYRFSVVFQNWSVQS